MTGQVNRDFCTCEVRFQKSWQVQSFWDLEVQISGQVLYFVDLEVQISCQVQCLVDLELRARHSTL